MKAVTFFSQDVQYCKHVGPKVKRTLNKKDIYTVYDLLSYFPRDYEDRRKPVSIRYALSKPDKAHFVKAHFLRVESIKIHGEPKPKVVFSDGELTASIVFFSGSKPLWMAEGAKFNVCGKFSNRYKEISCSASEIEADKGKANSFGGIVPVYPLTEGLRSKQLRKIIRTALENLSESCPYNLPLEIRRRYSLLPFIRALEQIHFPRDFEILMKARRTLIFEEFYTFQHRYLRMNPQSEGSKSRTYDDLSLFNAGMEGLPFELTGAQHRAVETIKSKMMSKEKMRTLLQGDVGCGKTAVAFLVALIAVGSGYQCAFIAPTEILAKQHYNSAKELLGGLGIKSVFISASLSSDERKAAIEEIAEGAPLVFGTHILISEELRFNRLALAVADEQHRFGVEQRQALFAKGEDVDYILMSATPIPRSLSMTLFGSLDNIVIDELPKGRKPVNTKIVKASQRAHCYKFLRSRLKKGEQGYVVFPAIDSSSESLTALTHEYELAQSGFFDGYRCAMVHGKMRNEDIDLIMQSFLKSEIDVLFATSIIEVGVHNANASTILINSADHFGLSQLHQFRGRVGRGRSGGFCYLIASDRASDTAMTRLKVLCEMNDGFKIAEEDLKIRGAGEFFSSRQSGAGAFKIGDVIEDAQIMKEAREAAVLFSAQSDEAFELRLKDIERRIVMKDSGAGKDE